MGQAGALPLLEFTLDQLFRQREGHLLTLEAYREIGGLKGALAKHAEDIYKALSEEHQRLARTLFLRLIDPGATEQDTTRRRAALAELSLPDPQQTMIIREAADAFIAARLLTTNEVAGTTTIEVSHEALIREWTRLADWLVTNRNDILLQQAISEDAAAWVRHGKPISSWLYRGTQLIEAQAWAERNVPSTNEVAFLHASAAERQRQEQKELDQKIRELTLQRRVVSRQRLLITALSIFSVVVIALASLAQFNFLQAQEQRIKADRETDIARTQAQIARSDALVTDATLALAQNKLDQALLLSVKASQANTPEARDGLLSTLEQSPQIVTMLRSGSPLPLPTLTFGSDGRTLVSTDSNSVYVWNTRTKQPQPLRLGNQVYVGAVAFSSDNRTLATSNEDGVWLWDIQTDAQPTTLAGKMNNNAPVTFVSRTTITFNSNGKLVASGRCELYSLSESTPLCIKTQISVWDLSAKSPHPMSSFFVPADVKSIAFSPDGKTLASGSNMGIQLWSVATGHGSPLTKTAGTNSVAFSPDGTLLASGNQDGTLQMWKVASEQLVGPPVALVGHTDAINTVAFSPDSQSQNLASSSDDGTVRVWNVASRQTTLMLHGDPQQKLGLAFAPGGKTLASGSGDGTIILWNITAESTISQPLADIGGLRSPVFSVNGTTIFTGSATGKILLQNVKTGRLVHTFDTTTYPSLTLTGIAGQNPLAIESLALSKDGRTLAAGRLDGTITLWNTNIGQALMHFGKPNPLYKIMLSSDGQVLAASGDGDTITLWNAATGTMLYTLPYHTTTPLSKLPIALSSDGKLLAVGSCGKMNNDGSCGQEQVELWDVATGKVKGGPLLGHQSAIEDVALSPDGHTLASSSRDKIILWNLTTGRPRSQTLSPNRSFLVL